MSNSERFDKQDRDASVQKKAALNRRPAKPKHSTRRTLQEAETAVLSAWREWAKTNLPPDKVGDGDVHSFLRYVKAENPDLLLFSSRVAPYEAAFRWIVGNYAGLQPLRHRI